MHWNWASEDLGQIIFCLVWFGYSAAFLTIALLSLERYIVIRYIWSADAIVTKRRSASAVVIIWLVSGISFIQLDHKKLSMHMFMLSSVFEICILVVITFYVKLWAIRRRHALQHHIALIKQENKLTKVVFALIVILVLTTLPLVFLYQLLHGLLLFCGRDCIDEVIRYIPAYLTPVFAVNFALNPAIYGWRLPKYRRSFSALWTIFIRNPARQKRDKIVMHKQRGTHNLEVTATQITNGSCTSL
jgi:hypothetical protein